MEGLLSHLAVLFLPRLLGDGTTLTIRQSESESDDEEIEMTSSVESLAFMLAVVCALWAVDGLLMFLLLMNNYT